MKIGFLTGLFFSRHPGEPETERILCEMIVKLGHEVVVLTEFRHLARGSYARLQTDPFEVYGFRASRFSVRRPVTWADKLAKRIVKVSRLVSDAAFVKRFLRDHPDLEVFHVMSTFHEGFVAAVARRSHPNLPLVISMRDHNDVMASGIRGWMSGWTLRQASLVRCGSRMLEERARVRWGLEGKLNVIPISLARDISLMTGDERERLRQTVRERILGPSREKGVGILIWVARMVPDKGADQLLAAVSLVEPSARRNLRVILCGEGTERRRLEKMTEEMSLSGVVQFLGFVDYEKLPSYLAAADILVVSSLHDAGPMVAIEAAVAGTPVILTDGCGYAGLFAQAEAGLVVPAGSKKGLADAIRSLLQDPERRAILATNAATLVKAMEPETVARSLIQLFERARQCHDEKGPTAPCAGTRTPGGLDPGEPGGGGPRQPL